MIKKFPVKKARIHFNKLMNFDVASLFFYFNIIG
jgi:hypothetical protein